MDWNGGITGDCQFCGERGFVYFNESLNCKSVMCDSCRESIERRKIFAGRITEKQDKEQ